MKTLIVYYSRSGTTRAVARRLGELLGGDVEEIRDMRSRKGAIGFMRSGFEALGKRKTAIVLPASNPKDYDLVVVGTPIWAGRIASPMRAYLNQMQGAIPCCACFCTSGGGGYASALEEMVELVGCRKCATLELTEKQVKSESLSSVLATFADKLRGDTQ